MSTPEQISLPVLGVDGEPCSVCGMPLAADQRYCLNCGARRGALRLPYERYLSDGRVEAPPPPAAAAPARTSDVSPLGAVIGIALLGGMLLIGVLLGRGEDQPVQTTTAPATSPESTAGGVDDSGGDDAAATGDVATDWPVDQEGFTVELGTLPKAGTTAADVDAAKADLEGRGATDVGVLDSDEFASLPPGNYVLYSGEYDTRGDAEDALGDVQASVPEATVTEISQGGGAGGKEDAAAALEALPDDVPIPGDPTGGIPELGPNGETVK